jgi:predicted nuclease of restriction endonuclease-like (RecB) superfamily
MEENKDLIKSQDNPVLPKQLVDDVKLIVNRGLREAYDGANSVLVKTYWNVGKRIVEEEQHGDPRAKYGKHLIDLLSQELSSVYPKGYSSRNLRDYRQFYLCFRDLEIWHSRVPNLTWTHYRTLLSVADDDARYWYIREASAESWSVRTLARNVGSQYYFRLLQTPKKDAVVNEMLQLTAPLQDEPQGFLKDPVVAEFLQLPSNASFTESELEKAIIRHLKEFLLEMGQGFAFMAEQYHISTDAGDFFVDLVFYNVALKCYVLIDLKTKKVTHQDVGQMDMYVRMFDDLKRTEGDNPTLGLLLCADTSKDIAQYSVLHDNKQLYAAKYLTYLPSEEVLRREIEQQKEIFYLQHGKSINENDENDD